MSYFNIVAQSSENTVVTEYKPQAKRSEAYQSEAQLEQEFIRLLGELAMNISIFTRILTLWPICADSFPN